MTYTHLTTDELVLIESYYHQTKKVKFVTDALNRSRQTIYNVYHSLDKGLSILDYYKRYKSNKKKCGRHSISLSDSEIEYVQKMVAKG